MAELYPFSNRTAALLAEPPVAGGTHRWLAQAACGLCRVLPAERCAAFLRRCCEVHVTHRRVPEREIAAAVGLAYGRAVGSGQLAVGSRVNYGRGALTWPEAEPELIAKVTAYAVPLFDGVTETGHTAADVLPQLFRPGELVCMGAVSERPLVRPVEAAAAAAGRRLVAGRERVGVWNSERRQVSCADQDGRRPALPRPLSCGRCGAPWGSRQRVAYCTVREACANRGGKAPRFPRPLSCGREGRRGVLRGSGACFAGD